MTFACHVYDSFYCKVIMIAICDMQSESTEAQCVMWQNLNKIMVNNGVPNPNFKGFMVDSTQTNWNTIRIVYGSGDASEPMVDKELTCFFHWSQSMDKHTKQHIKLGLQKKRTLCYEYKNAISLEKANVQYATIRYWWYSSSVIDETGLQKLENWLSLGTFM
jgi:hypothetical protein